MLEVKGNQSITEHVHIFYWQRQERSSQSLTGKLPLQWGACTTGNTEAAISHSNRKIHSSSTRKGRKYTENLENAEFQLSESRGKSIFDDNWESQARSLSGTTEDQETVCRPWQLLPKEISKAHILGAPTFLIYRMTSRWNLNFSWFIAMIH